MSQLPPFMPMTGHFGDLQFHEVFDFGATGSLPCMGGLEIATIHVADGWLIVAADEENDPEFTALGPFPTPELALICIRLGKD